MLACQKSAFSLPDDLHYLNCAYMAPLAKAVEAAGLAGMQMKRVPSDITPDDFFAPSDRLRALFATLINADEPNRVAIIPAASYGLATVARNTSVGRGQNIVVLEEQFPSNVYTWRRLTHTSGGVLRTVMAPEDLTDRAQKWNERLLDAIDPHTALVAVPPVHWADGTRFDLVALGQRAREVGAAFVIDGTQSVGALPFDVAEIGADAVVCAGYKWLLGPYNLGVAYFGPRYDDGVPIEENWITRAGSEDFAGLVRYRDDYQPGAIRYDVGERSSFGLVPMLAAGIELALAWGPDAIQHYCAGLVAEVIDDAVAMGFHIAPPAWRSAHLFGIRAPEGITPEQLRAALAAHQVSVSVRGDAVRVAPHVYNDAEDLAALQSALHSVVHTAAR